MCIWSKIFTFPSPAFCLLIFFPFFILILPFPPEPILIKSYLTAKYKTHLTYFFSALLWVPRTKNRMSHSAETLTACQGQKKRKKKEKKNLLQSPCCFLPFDSFFWQSHPIALMSKSPLQHLMFSSLNIIWDGFFSL